MNLNPSKGIALITDGSCWTGDRIGGWAWIAIDCFGGEEVGLGSDHDTTISRMELQAVISGLNALASIAPPGVIVYSDSEYVVLGANDRNRARKKNIDLWLTLDEVTDEHTYVEFIHIPGHSGMAYNERADRMAGEARVGAKVAATPAGS